MICKDCKYFNIKNSTGYSKAFCGHWKSKVGVITFVVKNCKYYFKKEIVPEFGDPLNWIQSDQEMS